MAPHPCAAFAGRLEDTAVKFGGTRSGGTRRYCLWNCLYRHTHNKVESNSIGNSIFASPIGTAHRQFHFLHH
jgi:hypothetical protein